MFNHKNGNIFSDNKRDIYYECIGNKDAYPLIFLHGGLQNIETFNVLLKSLSVSNYRIIGIDTNGHGRSKLNGSLTYKSIQSDVEALLSSLSVTRCSIIGHSDGGVVALRLAISQKLIIDNVVAMGAHWRADTDEETLEFYQSLTAQKWQDRFPDDVDYYQQINPEPELSRLLQEAIKLWTDTTETGYPGNTLTQINCPTFIIRGDDDFLVSREQCFEMSSLIEKSTLLNLPYAGHSVHIDSAELVGRLINEFLALE